MKEFPKWLLHLGEEDLKFIKLFLVNSGSLKEMASLYEVSYPTVRLRLNRLIEKINLYDEDKDTSMILLIKSLVIEEKIDYDVAKLLIKEYRKEK